MSGVRDVCKRRISQSPQNVGGSKQYKEVAVVADDTHVPTDGDIAEIRTDVKWIREKMKGHCDWQQRTDNRIGKLENWRSFLAGGFALLAFLKAWDLLRL